MIFITFLLALQIEVLAHYIIINKAQYDLTPDNKFITWSKIAVIAYRVIYCLGIYALLGEPTWLSLDIYLATCLFLHLLLFPIELNIVRGKPLHYLGNGPVDKLIGFIPSFTFRVWCFGLLAASGWYTYFNQHLL